MDAPRSDSNIDPVVETRLAELEREVREVRGRINTLFYSVLSVALLDLVGRVAWP